MATKPLPDPADGPQDAPGTARHEGIQGPWQGHQGTHPGRGRRAETILFKALGPRHTCYTGMYNVCLGGPRGPQGQFFIFYLRFFLLGRGLVAASAGRPFKETNETPPFVSWGAFGSKIPPLPLALFLM